MCWYHWGWFILTKGVWSWTRGFNVMHIPWKQASEVSRSLHVKQVCLGYKNLLNGAYLHTSDLYMQHTCMQVWCCSGGFPWDTGECCVVGCYSRDELLSSPGYAKAGGNLLNCKWHSSCCGFRKSALAVKFVSPLCVCSFFEPWCTELWNGGKACLSPRQQGLFIYRLIF